MQSPAHHERLTQWQLAASAAGCLGIQLSYAAQINLGTPQLLHLGISPTLVSIAWMAGPLSGLIVQPIVGHLSDRCSSSYGRRKPFILGGMICTVLSLLLFANSTSIASVFFTTTTIPDPTKAPSAPLVIAIVAFFFLDFSIQVVQAPMRTLLIDSVHPTQRSIANAYLAAFTGIGNLLGGLLAAAHLSDRLPFFPTDVQAVFAITSILALASIVPTLVVAPDAALGLHEYRRVDNVSTSADRYENSHQPPDSDSISAFSGLINIPRPFWRVFAVQLCTWCGFFTIFVHMTAWVGRDVFQGDGSAPTGSAALDAFQRGVRLGGLGNALNAIVTLVYALILPTLVRRLGTLIPYAFSQAVEAVCLLSAPFLHPASSGQSYQPSFFLRTITVVNISAFGVVWATTMTIPWTLIGDALQTHPYYARRTGFYTTIFNASQSFPQLVVAVVSAPVLRAAHGDPAYVMALAGFVALLGAILVFILRVDISSASERETKDCIDCTKLSNLSEEERTLSSECVDSNVKN